MASFAMCAACRAEYDDPADRRFHAQPIACPACGPRLRAPRCRPASRSRPATRSPIAARRLRDGADRRAEGPGRLPPGLRRAATRGAVAELRRRKHRDEKPFAVMVADLAAAAERSARSARPSATLLTSPRRADRPAARRRPAPPASPTGSRPGNPRLGVMLPYTPLHHLLLRRAARAAPGDDQRQPLRRADRLSTTTTPSSGSRGIADLFLTHDRPIHVRCDDSVTRVVGRRRAAGPPLARLRPAPLALPLALPAADPGRRRPAQGDLRPRPRPPRVPQPSPRRPRPLRGAPRLSRRASPTTSGSSASRPSCIVHDLHPDYASTRYALARAAGRRLAARRPASPRAHGELHGRERPGRAGHRRRASTAPATGPTARSGAASS